MRSEQDEPTVVTVARAILAGQRHPDDFDAGFDEATVFGFHVDLDALEGAARDIRDTIRDRNSIDVRDICGAAELYGHAGFARRVQRLLCPVERRYRPARGGRRHHRRVPVGY